MSRFVWFRLMVRLVGLWLVATSAPSVVGGLISLISMLILPGAFPGGGVFWLQLAWPVASSLELGAGVYFLFFGKRLIAWCLRDVDNSCGRCGYDISGVNANACPECGMRLTETLPMASADGQGGERPVSWGD